MTAGTRPGFTPELALAKLSEIADYFNLGHGGSVSFIMHQVIKKRRQDKRYNRLIDGIIASIVKLAT